MCNIQGKRLSNALKKLPKFKEGSWESSFFHPIDLIFARQICPEAEEKAFFFIAYLLKTAREGHLCATILPTSDDWLREGASQLPSRLFDQLLIKESNRIYLRRNWECEQLFLRHLHRLKFQKPVKGISKRWLENRLDNERLNTEQKKAILMAAERSLTLITGGPGTGKTYTASMLIKILLEAGLHEIIAVAPTGKATANLRTCLQDVCRVQTLQSLLNKDQLFADLLIVDEGSMVDASLMAKLFSSIKEGGRLVLLGDKDQLPPVETGNFFTDLAIDTELTAVLNTCLRTDLQEIVDLAEKVKNGEQIPTLPLPGIQKLVEQIINEDAYVLTPLKKGLYGSENLNQVLHREHQKRGAEEIPIIITVNDAYLELFNGDTGVLKHKEGVAYFSGGRSFPEYLLPRYTYAYVLSVHKSQGSEYENIIVLLPEGSENFGREMLYTAITRAKFKVSILAHEGIAEKIVATHFSRHSGIIVDSTKNQL